MVFLDNCCGLFACRFGNFQGAGLASGHLLEARCCKDSIVRPWSDHAAGWVPTPRLDN